jgi:hypothetical protein
MEFSIESIKAKASTAKLNSKFNDLKKAEFLIEKSADKGKDLCILTADHVYDLDGSSEFIISNLRDCGFEVIEDKFCGRLCSIWIYWRDKK